MFNSKFATARWFLLLISFINLPIQKALCADGVVGIGIEWGTTSRGSYTYVFSGLITCKNRPCANTHVEIDLQTPNEGAISQTTQTGDDGRYQVAVTVKGAPEDSNSWKIAAHISGLAGEQTAEAEGRVILTDDQKTVVVDRALQLIQA